MKILGLQLLSNRFYLGEQKGSLDGTTHDFERLPGEGFLVKHRHTGKVFFVPYAHAIAEIAPAEEEDDAAPPAGRPASRRARKATDTPDLQG